jgi:hypothetical protein
MVNNKYLQIVDRLIYKTNQRDIEWKEGVYPGAFQVSFPNYSLTLAPCEGEHGDTDYVIAVIDSDGNTIDTFSDVDLGGDYFPKLAELYQNARRQALGVDKALDEILDELGAPF